MDLDNFYIALKLLAETELQTEYNAVVEQALSHFAPQSAAQYE